MNTQVVAVYGRQSNPGQSEQTFDFQRQTCLEHASANGYHIFTGHCFPFGTTISKTFGGKIYEGKIISFDEFYKIQYEDNDCEEMTHSEIYKYIKSLPNDTTSVGLNMAMTFDRQTGTKHAKLKEMNYLLDNFTGDEQGNGKCFSKLIIYKVDRFGRNVEEALERLNILRKKGITVETAEKGKQFKFNNHPQDRFDFINELNRAELFSKSLSQDIKQRIEKEKENGTYKPKRPYGYMNGEDQDGKVISIPNPEEQRVIKLVYDLLHQYRDYEQVAKHLNENKLYKYSHSKVSARHHKEWTHNMVKNLYENNYGKFQNLKNSNQEIDDYVNSEYRKCHDKNLVLENLFHKYNLIWNRTKLNNRLTKETKEYVKIEKKCDSLVSMFCKIAVKKEESGKRKQNHNDTIMTKRTKYDSKNNFQEIIDLLD